MFSYLTTKVYQLKKFMRSANDNGKRSSSWAAPPVGPPLGKYKCDGEPHLKYQNGLMPSPRKGTLNEQLSFWKGQKRRLGFLTQEIPSFINGGRINEHN